MTIFKNRCLAFLYLFALVGCMSEPNSELYSYTIEFGEGNLPDMRKCKLIIWEKTSSEDSIFTDEYGGRFMFEPLHDNGIKAGLITEFGRINCNSIAKGMSLEFIPENVDENIRRSYALDEFVRHDANGNVDTCEMLVVRGWVMEKTFGTNDAVRMESNHVIRNVLRQHPRGLALIRDKEIVERVYAFYSNEGVKVVEVRVKIPHRFFSTYSRWRGVEAAKKAVGLALGLLQNGVHCNRKGELEWRRGAEGQFTISEIRTTSPILGTQEGLSPVNMSQ